MNRHSVSGIFSAVSIWQSGTFYIGETWIILGYVRDDQGQPIDLTGAIVQLRITLGNVLIFDLVTPTNGEILDQTVALGAYQFDIDPSQQASLVLTTYQFEVRATLADATTTIQSKGEITLLPSRFVNFPPA